MKNSKTCLSAVAAAVFTLSTGVFAEVALDPDALEAACRADGANEGLTQESLEAYVRSCVLQAVVAEDAASETEIAKTAGTNP